jgi:hypothetical protein
MPKDDYFRILAQTRKFARKWQMLLVCEGLAYVAALFILSVLLGFASDNLFHFSPILRGAILVVLLLALLALLYIKVLRKLAMRISPERAAVYIESRLGEFDNRLINALQLGKDEESLNNAIIRALVSEAQTELRRRSLRNSLDFRKVGRSGAILGAAGLVLTLYSLFFGSYFQNAFARFSRLTDGPLPITRINLSVTPGDATVFLGDDLEVAASPSGGPLPEAAYLVQRDERKKSIRKMDFDGERFAYSFHTLQHGLRYRVVAEDFRSRWYEVVVGEPLRVDRIDMTLAFPEYLRIPAPVELSPAGTEVRVLQGTRAELHIFANKEVRGGQLLMADVQQPLAVRSARELVGKITVTEDLTYRIRMESSLGDSSSDSFARKILSFDDQPPTAELLEPKSGYLGGDGEPLTIIARATDDVALSSVRILMERERDGTEPAALAHWEYNPGPNETIDALKRGTIETAKVNLRDYLQAGESALLSTVVRDMKGNESLSSKVRITLLSESQRSELEQAEKESIFEKLREILDLQVQACLATDKSTGPQDASLQSAREHQVDVHGRTLVLIDRLSQPTQLDYAYVRTVLLGLSTNQMPDVVKRMNALTPESFSENKPVILQIQNEITHALKELLGELTREEEPPPEGEAAPPKDKPLADALSKLRELKTALDNFIAEQKKVITSSLELQKKKPEDYTQEDLDLKQKVQIVEDQWAKFLQEKSSELEKIPQQDFSDPTLLKELRQIYEEIEVAADELSKPGARIPVTEEEVGLELAEKLEHNLESWLPNESDKLKWELEEPSTPPDVPMAELPEELEDIIGDLIREEQDLDPEMEDVSSSWMDSIDAGAGWDVMDGPISNMSAKGKTGNTLPNSSEISGRSAEGRTGKSNGEFVSDTAIGQGGRRTPTRVMNDPYENATVDDRMTEPTGGATGGGKRSGAGGEGLRGHVPPDLQTRLSDLRGRQADLITRGEKVLHDFEKLNLDAEKLDDALQKMRDLDSSMERFKHTDLVAANKEIVDGLKSTQDISSREWTIRREQNARLPTKVRKILNDTLNTEFPRDYETLLREYYKAIAE